MAQIDHMLTEEEIQGLFRGDRGVAELLERVLREISGRRAGPSAAAETGP